MRSDSPELLQNAKSQTNNPKTKEYLDMESLFTEHGQQIESDSDTLAGTATLSDFIIEDTENKQSSESLSIKLFFSLPTGNFGVYKTNYSNSNPDAIIDSFLEDNFNPTLFSDILGSNIQIWKQEEDVQWKTEDYGGFTITEVVQKPEWEPAERNKMDEKFRELKSNHTKTKKSGEAEIIDYYVQSSASNIQQKLEIGIKFQLPDNSVEMYECIHDTNHPDDGLKSILSYCGNPEKLYSLLNEQIPVKYNIETEKWMLHIPAGKTDSKIAYACDRLICSLERIGVYPTTDKRTITIEKTYNHMNEEDSSETLNPEIKEKVEQLKHLENFGI